MPKRTFILLIVLAVITAGLLFIALRARPENPTPTTGNETQTINKNMIPGVKKTATLSFAPSTLMISPISSSSAATYADVMVATDGQKVSGVQLELKFDPNVVSNLRFDSTVNTVFGSSYFSPDPLIDYAKGTALYMIAVDPKTQPFATSGTVVRLYFSAKNPGGQNSSIIALQEESKVTQENTDPSILAKTESLTLQFGQ